MNAFDTIAAMDISHWLMMVSGLGFGVAIGIILAVLVRWQGTKEREGLDERLCMIESWLRQIVTFQDTLAKKDIPLKKEQKPWKWTL